jgi:hypothetical protein
MDTKSENELKNTSPSMRNTTIFRIEGEITKKIGRPKKVVETPVVKQTKTRPANSIEYRDNAIDDIPCVVGTIISKGEPLEFIIDKDDEERVKSRQWYAGTGGKYIACSINFESGRKTVYLHNFIMNKLDFPGKGAKETVDHINRNGLDNRKSNLRIISQTMQNVNQKKKKRTAQLPEGIAELPKHIWYIKAQGLHGDRFAVELKTEKIVRKTTSSKTVSIQEKLAQALKIRDELYAQFPYLKSE